MQGIEECSICYCILHTNNELPKRTCRTCKKKFHDACLVSKRRLSGNINGLFALIFSFVGFDHRINRHVHIVERTFNYPLFADLLFLTLIISLFFDINMSCSGCLFSHEKKKQIFFTYRSLMSVDKAKESAAYAAVDEQINHVGMRRIHSFDHRLFRMYVLSVLDLDQQLFQQ